MKLFSEQSYHHSFLYAFCRVLPSLIELENYELQTISAACHRDSGSSRAGALRRRSHRHMGDGCSIRGEAQAKAPGAGETSVDSRLNPYPILAL